MPTILASSSSVLSSLIPPAPPPPPSPAPSSPIPSPLLLSSPSSLSTDVISSKSILGLPTTITPTPTAALANCSNNYNSNTLTQSSNIIGATNLNLSRNYIILRNHLRKTISDLIEKEQQWKYEKLHENTWKIKG